MNRVPFKGHTKAPKGKIKEVTGRMIDDKTMAMEGDLQEYAGKVRARIGNVRDDLRKNGASVVPNYFSYRR